MRGWSLVYEQYEPRQEGLREALCTVGNGYFATRGASPDVAADAVHYPGTYLAGGYNRLATRVGGVEIENEDLVNLPNWLPLTCRIADGDWFRIDHVEILSYRQELDLRRGVLHRQITFRDRAARTTSWTERRLVSMANCHLAALSVEIRALDWSGKLNIRSALDGGVTNDGVARYRELAGRHLETLELDQPAPETIFLLTRTNQSHIHVALAARTSLHGDGCPETGERELAMSIDRIAHTLSCTVGEGEAVAVEKVVALHSSRDRGDSEPGLEARRSLARAGRFDDLLSAHEDAWRELWNDCDIALDDFPDGTTANRLRVSIFHLLQTVSPHSIDTDTGVPARGWHGEAYRGHVFWDELFVFPFLDLRLPVLARALLLYRYRRLPEARRAARVAGYRGAMFPWQSGSNGREESQRLHLNPKSGRWVSDNSHLQRHISSAIAYNIWKYYEDTDDLEFLCCYGAEMLIEIARFWASIATYNAAIDRYEIKGVVGPDEYHTGCRDADPGSQGGIDNNAYTNVMAAWVLNRARDAIDGLPRRHIRGICGRLGLGPAEIERWDEISRKLRIVFHDDGIISQFEGYDALEELDWRGYEARYGDIQRLDRILEAEGDTPDRYKASKQADVLMLFYLLSPDELARMFEQMGYPFDSGTIVRNVRYYLARTSHGSTLSRVVHSRVLARTDRPRSWCLFQQALDSDVEDIQGGTTAEGIHAGAMAGTIDLVQRCYLGIENRARTLYFDPALPEGLGCLRMKLRYRGQTLDVTVTQDILRIASESCTASPVAIACRGHIRDVTPGETYEFRLLKPEDRDPDENRSTPAIARPRPEIKQRAHG